ncbi:hypothetical protein ACF044_17150 [Microbacterium sp. NPDC016588]
MKYEFIPAEFVRPVPVGFVAVHSKDWHVGVDAEADGAATASAIAGTDHAAAFTTVRRLGLCLDADSVSFSSLNAVPLFWLWGIRHVFGARSRLAAAVGRLRENAYGIDANRNVLTARGFVNVDLVLTCRGGVRAFLPPGVAV